MIKDVIIHSMVNSVSVKKVRFKGEERFVILAMMKQNKPNDPFMRSSDLGNPLTRKQALSDLQEMGMSQDEAEQLLAQAESEPA